MTEQEKPTILVVDDNEDIATNVKYFLEFSGFTVYTASNGKEAFEVLGTLDNVPDVIVSDIMMPEMDGYEFFKAVSSDTRYMNVPFIFLSAKSSPEDVRLGKILGVDDYMIKPFNQEDLLASITGKIARSKNAARMNDILVDSMKDLETTACDEKYHEESAYLIYMVWDDKIGPNMQGHYPLLESTFNLRDIGYQLFNAASAIYGDKFNANAEGVVLMLANIHEQAFLLFDSYPDETTRSGVVLYMLGVIDPCISYLASLSIKKVLQELSKLIKTRKPFDLRKFHERITKILTST